LGKSKGKEQRSQTRPRISARLCWCSSNHPGRRCPKWTWCLAGSSALSGSCWPETTEQSVFVEFREAGLQMCRNTRQLIDRHIEKNKVSWQPQEIDYESSRQCTEDLIVQSHPLRHIGLRQSDFSSRETREHGQRLSTYQSGILQPNNKQLKTQRDKQA